MKCNPSVTRHLSLITDIDECASAETNECDSNAGREEDPCTRENLEGETYFRLVYMQKFRSGWLLEIK